MLPWVVEAKQPQYIVRYNRRSMIISLMLMLNLASMPLKAYLSEPYPWAPNLLPGIPLDCATNFTSCAPFVLTFFVNQSNQFTSNQYTLSTDVFDLFRIPFPLLPAQIDDPTTCALSFPYALFFTREQKNLAIAVARGQLNVSEFGASEIIRIFGVAVSYGAIYSRSGTTENTMFVGLALAQMSTMWLIFKFIFRLCLSVYIAWYMWKKYYLHYSNLAANLGNYGLKDAPKVRSFEIVVGDPTSIILLNPIVSALFAFDFWISVDFVSRAFVRIDQLVGMNEFFVAYMYLSRTLWLAYSSLSCISYILKKVHCERYFHGIDPTWTAIMVAIAAGPFSYLQSRTELFVKFYYFLFTFTAREDNELEAFFAAALYAFTIGTLPVLFGFLPDQLFKCPRLVSLHFNRSRRASIQPSSYLNNNFKNRWALQLSLFSLKKTEISTQGGSVYNLFKLNNRFKKHLGISQQGADCYIKWRSGTRQWTCFRLSLLTCIDVQPPIQLVTSPYPCAFGKVNMQLGIIHITQGSNASPWVL